MQYAGLLRGNCYRLSMTRPRICATFSKSALAASLHIAHEVRPRIDATSWDGARPNVGTLPHPHQLLERRSRGHRSQLVECPAKQDVGLTVRAVVQVPGTMAAWTEETLEPRRAWGFTEERGFLEPVSNLVCQRWERSPKVATSCGARGPIWVQQRQLFRLALRSDAKPTCTC